MTDEHGYGTDRLGMVLRLMDEGFTRIESRLDRVQEGVEVIDSRTRSNEAVIAAVRATCEERGKYCPAAAGRPDVMFSMRAGTTRPNGGAGLADVMSSLTPKAWAVVGTGLTVALILVQLLERVVVGYLNHLGAAIR